MIDNLKPRVASLAAVAAVVFCSVLTGCDKTEKASPPESPKPVVYENRMEDPAYRQALTDARAEQKKIARGRNAVVEEMEKVIAAARAALPKDATDGQVKAELESHPEKYPTWKDLSEKIVVANGAAEKNLAEVRRTVRARMLKEVADRQAVANGKAMVHTAPAPKK